MTPEQRQWIDSASYEELLRKWRYAVVGDPLFQGECGDYYVGRMKKLRAEGANHIAASKNIGWDG